MHQKLKIKNWSTKSTKVQFARQLNMLDKLHISPFPFSTFPVHFLEPFF